MNAVGMTLWHQSQEATDCRWVRVLGQIFTKKLHIPGELLEEFVYYPDRGDQRSVRPNIRATEMAQNPLTPPDLTWSKNFWEEAWNHSPCLVLIKHPPAKSYDGLVNQARVLELMVKLKEHWGDTHSTTSIDPKHDGVFGMIFYCLRILHEMLIPEMGNSILGRLGLRTVLEVRITLKYLLQQDNQSLWKKWREYGAGQAKLNTLKFDDLVEPPKHIDAEAIAQIAGEDVWEEFVTINLASWSGLDLRKMSEKSNLKNVYDQHYSWTSGYSHGVWGPIREACYETCGNPLHRFHRYPASKPLHDTVGDAVDLVNEILTHLNDSYPTFSYRL